MLLILWLNPIKIGGGMRGFLINKNLCLYHWLKKRIGKKLALWVANTFEKVILIFGREVIPYFDKNTMSKTLHNNILSRSS
jgi:hypothetical protein